MADRTAEDGTLGNCESSVGRPSGAVLNQQVLAALQERVKELTCLYEISHIAERPEAPLDEIVRGIVELLPPAWQYPQAARARIVLDGRDYATPSYCEGVHKQSADIIVNGERRGMVEVTYVEPKAELDEGPFLAEERKLIDAVAREVARIVDRRRVQAEQAALQE